MKRSDKYKKTTKIGGKKVDNPLGVITKDALNRLLQSGATIVFKKAAALLSEAIRGVDWAETLIFYHDEVQSFVREDMIEQYKELAHKCVKEAGEYFKLNIPVECDIKVGNNWAECH